MKASRADFSGKKTYSPPTATKRTPEEAINLVMDRLKCTEQEANDLLDSLRKELQQKELKEDAA
jgi:hypothetical protein